jgi:hypothetical protein
MKPNFIVIGAMKCATTSLCDIFAAHPQIFVCAPKEPDFFCKDPVYQRGWDWYESLFAGAERKVAVGEGSTNCTKQLAFPFAAERVAKHLPEAKLIYIVRHPLKRMESHWLHLIACGEKVHPFHEEVRKRPAIVDTSLYWKQINAYRRHYSDQQILALFFEDFRENPVEVMTRCYEFLGVDPNAGAANPSTASHVSAGMKIDSAVIGILKKLPLARAVKNAAPGLARKITDNFRRPMPGRPVWPEDLRREVISQVADDARTFLKFHGKPDDYWSL